MVRSCKRCDTKYQSWGGNRGYCSLACRFWSNVEDGSIPSHRPELGPCWIGLWSRRGRWHCHLPVNGKYVAAHRIAWELTHGPIPTGMNVLHKCDEPRCVRVDHLFLGTQAENMRDCSRKGRIHLQRHPEKSLKGGRHGNAELWEDAVRAIREAAAGGISQKRLAKVYGVSTSTISSVVKRKAWRHIA